MRHWITPGRIAVGFTALLLTACGGSASPAASPSAVASTSAPRSQAAPAISNSPAAPSKPAAATAASSNVKVGAQEIKTFSGHKNFVTSVTFDPAGSTLASGALDQETKLWDVSSGQATKSLDQPGQAVNGVSFSKDGKLLATAGGNIVVVWNLATGKQALKPIKVQTNPTEAYAVFSPDGKTLLTGTRGDALKAFEAATGEPSKTIFQGPSGQVTALTYSPDGSLIAAATGPTVNLLDPVSGQLKQKLSGGGSKDLLGIAFSPDGKLLASAGHDGLQLWEAASGKKLKTLVGNSSLASSSDLLALATIDTSGVAFSPDGKLLVAGGSSGLRLWEVGSGQPVKVPETWGSIAPTGHAGAVNAMAFSPDGKLLASGGYADSIKLWQIGQ